jgi:hypothetical protein
VSQQASLHSSLQYRVGVLHLGVEKWRRASESAGQVSLPVACQAARVTQPDRLTCSCDHVSHVLRHHVGVTTVERPDPKGLPTFSRAPSYCHTGDSDSCPPDLELGALTECMAS